MAQACEVITVYIVDDESDIRRMISWLVKELGYLSYPFASASDFLEAVPYLERGCLLVDLRMNDISGIELIEATASMRTLFPAVLMTGHATVENVIAAMKAGAIDVMQKPVSIDRLAAVLSTAKQYLEPVMPPNLGESVVAIAREHNLTKRQTDILEALVAGRSNKQIAIDLSISARTVEMHRAAVMAKLSVRSLPALLHSVIAAGVVSPLARPLYRYIRNR